MLGSALAELEYALAAAALLVVVWLARELALAHRWRRLITALDRLSRALEALEPVEVVVVDESGREGPHTSDDDP